MLNNSTHEVSGKKAGLLGLAGCFCAAVLFGSGIMTQEHQMQQEAATSMRAIWE